MEFIEAPAFTRNVSAYLADDEFLQLQMRLAENPETGDLMPGMGGFRKLDRFQARQRPPGWTADYLLLLSDRRTDMAHDRLQQERGFRPRTSAKEVAKGCPRG